MKQRRKHSSVQVTVVLGMAMAYSAAVLVHGASPLEAVGMPAALGALAVAGTRRP